MSEAGISEPMGDPSANGQSSVTAGMMIRSAREAAGLHVAALAVSMKIPVKKLEALEADRLDLLHDAVFVRALAASVCRTLKIDPAPVLSKLPSNTAPRLNVDERGINAPFHASGNTTGMSIPVSLSKPTVMVVIALLLGGIAVVYFPDIKMSDWSGDMASQQAKTVEAQSQMPTSQPVQPEIVEAPAFPPSVLPSSPSSPASANEFAGNAQNPITASSVPVVPAGRQTAAVSADANPASADATAATSGLLVFKARGPVWVKVVDAKGIVQLSKTLAAGDVVGASGATPLSVVIGRVDATEVEVRGKAFSLTGVSKDNVARFEVK